MTKMERLESIARRSTRYEVVAERGDERLLIGYTIHPSRSGILAAVRRNPQQVITRLAIGPDDVCTWRGKGRFGHVMDMGNGWQIKLSSRTERDAIIAGELQQV